jgi:hypothetical protein
MQFYCYVAAAAVKELYHMVSISKIINWLKLVKKNASYVTYVVSSFNGYSTRYL